MPPSNVKKKYIGVDVVTEAKRRIKHIYDLHDDVVVSFSGGKDSLAVLHLVKEISDELGIGHVNAVFRDEEVIPFDVVRYLERLRVEYPWMRLTWLTVPMAAHTYILGKSIRYIQWDLGGREWIRPKPEHATNLEDLKLPAGTVLSENSMDDVLVAQYPGKVALLNGIRADESLTRWRASINKLNENYINASSSRRVNFCKPIFDWAENDVFRYFYDQGITYCPQYERKMWAGAQLRVATAINVYAMQHFKLREVDPELYERAMTIFPDLTVQERYGKELKKIDVIEIDTFKQVYSWIRENRTGRARKIAMSDARSCELMALKEPEVYPPSYVLHELRKGGRNMIMPLTKNDSRRRNVK